VTIEIRLERGDDRDAALEVERLAFDAHGSAEEEVAIVEAVRDDDGSFALVATDDGAVVGHIQFSRGSVGETQVVALGPIGVHPDRQGEGLGGRLIREVLGEARRRGEAAVMLLGDRAYYGRFGFRPGLALGLRNPFAGRDGGGFVIDEEDFMLVVLDEDASLAGEVRWHRAFG
jgi:putative acetyltransferase